jgi:hypothetical protein
MKNKKIPLQEEFQNLLKNHRDRDKISNKEIHFVVKLFFYVRFAQVQVMK